MSCPKCGFQQDGGETCLRCGIVFTRYHAAAELRRVRMESAASPIQPEAGLFRRLYRIFRWVGPAALIIALMLIFRPSHSPQIELNPEATKRAETKLQEFHKSMGQGSEQRLDMDESELNGWLSANLALKKPQGSDTPAPQKGDSLIDTAKTATGGQSIDKETLEQARSSIRDVKIELLEDALRIYALFDVRGVDMSLEIEGQPVVRDGYLKLEPTGGKLGSFPLVAGALRSVTDRLFDSPQNKEKFKLPPDIQDIRIENAHLVIISR